MRAPFQRLALREFLANRHQAGHLGLGDADLLAAPGGKGGVGNRVVGRVRRRLRRGGRFQDSVHLGSEVTQGPAKARR
jgi:hypothetical protein